MCQLGMGEFRYFSFCFKPIVGEVPQHGRWHWRRCYGVNIHTRMEKSQMELPVILGFKKNLPLTSNASLDASMEETATLFNLK